MSVIQMFCFEAMVRDHPTYSLEILLTWACMLKNTTYDQHGYTPNLYKNQNCEQKVKIGREIGEKKN